MFTSGSEGGVPMTAKELAKRRARRVVGFIIGILVIAFMSFVGLITYAGMGTTDVERGSLAYHFFMPKEVTEMPLYGVCAPPRYSIAPGEPATDEAPALPAQATVVYGTRLDEAALFRRYAEDLEGRGCQPADWCKEAKDPKACYVCISEDFPWMRRVHVGFPAGAMPAPQSTAAQDAETGGAACRRAFVAVSE
jgi:hypothetical protein